MRELLITYEAFRQAASIGAPAALRVYYMEQGDGSFLLAAAVTDFLYTAYAATPAQIADFNTYKAHAFAVGSTNDALALASVYNYQNLIQPRTSDGKQIVLPNLFPGVVTLYLAGAGDSGSVRGAGDLFALASDVAGDTHADFQFLDWYYAAGGGLKWEGGQVGDHVSLKAWCPATPVAPNAAGTGNCNLVDPGVGAAILIVPASGTGAFDVDLALANPIPADTDDDGVGEGFYGWDAPDVGRGDVTVGAPGASLFNLFAIDIDLARFVNKLPLLGAGVYDMTVPAIKPKKILPQWKQRVVLHNVGHAGLSLVWYLTTARVKTL